MCVHRLPPPPPLRPLLQRLGFCRKSGHHASHRSAPVRPVRLQRHNAPPHLAWRSRLGPAGLPFCHRGPLQKFDRQVCASVRPQPRSGGLRGPSGVPLSPLTPLPSAPNFWHSSVRSGCPHECQYVDHAPAQNIPQAGVEPQWWCGQFITQPTGQGGKSFAPTPRASGRHDDCAGPHALLGALCCGQRAHHSTRIAEGGNADLGHQVWLPASAGSPAAFTSTPRSTHGLQCSPCCWWWQCRAYVDLHLKKFGPHA